MATEPVQPQITITQLELWMSRPETRIYIEALEQKLYDVETQAGTGQLVDSGNADLTHALIHRALGEQDGLKQAMNPERLMSTFDRIKYEEKDAERS